MVLRRRVGRLTDGDHAGIEASGGNNAWVDDERWDRWEKGAAPTEMLQPCGQGRELTWGGPLKCCCGSFAGSLLLLARPMRTSVSSAVQGPQGPPGRIPSAPETRAFSLRISVDSGRVAPGHEAPHQFDHSSRHFRGRTGPVRQARFAGVCRCSKWVSATPEAPSARHSVPHAGSVPQQGSRQPGSPPGAPVVSPYLRGWGRRAHTHPRSPSHRPPWSREHKAFHEQPCSNPQAGGGPPRLPSRGRLAPPQTARGPTPSRVSAQSGS
ncbi:hypothetical protein NDU88_004478 [Pleurodeles waltl]|uniref:Uncharacterized protein n=1 Tax=Pleurodeles waltl TaxID=8319 RepID=A0AAV7MUN9_PLEWA|nr:hypothetical protein NDU88_004478 [Pleurodeles waltl]